MSSSTQAVRRPLWRRILKVILCILLIVVILAVGLVAYLSINEYKPADQETLDVLTDADDGGKELSGVTAGSPLSLLTWNIGYGALGDNADFFMDGGSEVYTADEARVQENTQNIIDEITSVDPDFVFLQEADVDSARSYHIDEVQEIRDAWSDAQGGSAASTFAYNFKVAFIPYPIPPIGKVNSGIETLSRYNITDSTRIQLPCPFKWPVRVGNLKRCLMVDRVPVTDSTGADTGKELVLINLHLEAYDSGEGKVAQTNMLREILEEEKSKGNYVIAGGDFNQTFSGVDTSMYPEREGTWHCGQIDESEFDGSWQFLMDNTTPTCRSLDTSYAGKDPTDFQFYMIDGFIVSSNIEVDSVKTQDLQFHSSDHNPVELKFTLR